MAIRKIRQYEDTFETPEFCNNAVEIYRKAHELMSEKNKEEIQDYVTEKAYGEILHNTDNKTIRWQFIKSLDLPRLVHARTTDLITNTNIFAQITVRLHTQQVFIFNHSKKSVFELIVYNLDACGLRPFR